MAPWLVNDTDLGGLASLTASAPKSSSGVDGTIALNPIPVIGTANAVLLSALTGLLTVNVAARGNGQRDGGSPPSAVDGNQGQPCWGENEIAMVQLCCGARANADPGGFAQLSCSGEIRKPLKSLSPKGLVFPD